MTVVALMAKIFRTNGKPELIDFLYLYRYSTLVMISVFFLAGNPAHSIPHKLIVAGCIGVSAVLLNYLYRHFLGNSKVVAGLIMTEVVFNVSILIPSGGFNSPYIWYSLNTIIIASVVLKRKIYCWINLMIYLFFSTYVSCRMLAPDASFMNMVNDNSNLILSLILITGAVQILSGFYGKVQSNNEALKEANRKIKKSVDHIMELYQAVHLMTTRKDRENLINTILEYTKKITKSLTVFYIRNREGKKEIIFHEPGKVDPEEMKEKLEKEAENITQLKTPITLEIDKRKIVLVPVFCQCKVHGWLGAERETCENAVEDMDIEDQLTFLSELASITLENFLLERINRDLAVNEEQNRIANEIHDGVLQKLFAISCGIFGLKRKVEDLSAKKIAYELDSIQASLNSAMNDLRTTIYGYSWKKNGINNFLDDVYKLIKRTRKYHGTEIDFEIKGNLELITAEQKKAFYRILSEGIGNAVRHGKADNISIQLNILRDDAILKISDNGTGFSQDILKDTGRQGLGIRNIKTLADSLNGNLQILSETGKGTSINLRIPVRLKTQKEELYESVGC